MRLFARCAACSSLWYGTSGLTAAQITVTWLRAGKLLAALNLLNVLATVQLKGANL